MIKRFDFVFSYWIFAWYILYELGFNIYNPKIAIIIALIDNIALLCLMIYFSNSLINIGLFCLINFFIKVIPLWRLRNTNYKISDCYALLFLFLLYISWLYINKVNITKLLQERYDKIKNNDIIGPFMYYMKNIFTL